MVRNRCFALCAALLGALTLGCAGDSSEGSPGTTAGARFAAPAGSLSTAEGDSAVPGREPSHPGRGSQEQVSLAVRQAVDDYWQAIVEAGDPPDPEHSGLGAHLTGEALERSREIFVERSAAGLRTLNPSGVEVVGALVDVSGEHTAAVRHCFVANEQLLDSSSDEVVSVEDQAVEVLLHLVVEDGAWKVTRNEVLESREQGSC